MTVQSSVHYSGYFSDFGFAKLSINDSIVLHNRTATLCVIARTHGHLGCRRWKQGPLLSGDLIEVAGHRNRIAGLQTTGICHSFCVSYHSLNQLSQVFAHPTVFTLV